MKRYHQEKVRIARRHRRHSQWIGIGVDLPVQERDLQPGRFRKRNPIGCGRPRCQLCHFDKIFSVPSFKDHLRQQKFKDSLNDFYEERY